MLADAKATAFLATTQGPRAAVFYGETLGLRQLSARGVTFERFPGMDQDAQGVWLAPSGAQVTWFRDPDGNLLSIAEYPPTRHR